MNNKVVSAVALLVIGAVLFGLHLRAQVPSVNVRIPFAGTPAEQWRDGAEGIGVPGPDPVYEQVRQALVASRTDPVMISEHKPDRFLAMLAPDVRDQVARDLSGWTTRLKTGTRLIGLKVSGKMTLGQKNGYPAVVTDYVFAYAFEPPDPEKLRNQMEMVAASRQQVTFTVTPAGLWPSDAAGFQYSIACRAARDGFLAPQFTEPAGQSDGVTKDDRRYFSTDGSVPTENSCD